MTQTASTTQNTTSPASRTQSYAQTTEEDTRQSRPVLTIYIEGRATGRPV